MEEVIILIVLILVNGFFALSEIALVSSKKTRLEQKKKEGSSGAARALQLLEHSETFLSAIQVGITLIGIITGVYGGTSIANDVAPFFQRFNLLAPYAHEIALILTVIIITFVSIVIGELVPKTIALNNPNKVAVIVAPVIFYFSKIFYVFVRLLSLSTSFIDKLLGIKKHTERITEAELRQMIKTASTEGVIEKEQNKLHEKVFYFADKKAKHIMTHRLDIEWFDINQPDDAIKKILLNSSHSKILCANGNLDNITGILRIRDYFKAISSPGKVDIKKLLIRPIFVPESMDAQKVLTVLKQEEAHICCVVNEYGGFEGLITLHNIIENIVGHIPDEGDVYEPDVFVRDDKSVLVNGDAPIETLTDIIPDFTIDFENISYSTVAGFVIDKLSRLPRSGDKITFNNCIIEVIDIDGKKIDKVLITKKEKENASADTLSAAPSSSENNMEDE